MTREIMAGFEWLVSQEGFRWVDEAPRGTTSTTFTLGGVLRDIDSRPPSLIGPPVGIKTRTVSYHPLDECPGLHRTFADLPLEKEAILKSAQRYGQLTKGEVMQSDRDALGVMIRDGHGQTDSVCLVCKRGAPLEWNHPEC